MLESLFPKSHGRYADLPIVGGALEGFCAWLHARGLPRDAMQRRVRAAVDLDRRLRRAGVRSLGELTRTTLLSCAPPRRGSNAPPLGALVRSLTRYLEERRVLASTPPTPTDLRVMCYRQYFGSVRGCAAATTVAHMATVREFLQFIDYDARPGRLGELGDSDVESFIANVGRRVGRDRLSHVISMLRAFLRYLATTAEGAQGLHMRVDAPRVFRGERVPRHLPWETVRVFLEAIDRTSPKGRRDYAIFLLVATYGLRAGEVRTLCLEDVLWRERQIRVPGSKTGTRLLLPLTDEVADALLDYLRRGRPLGPWRQLFLRVEAPVGPLLSSAAIWNAFTRWMRRAGVPQPTRGGPHCLRHSLAMRLVQQGVSLKAVGDIFGHRSTESTGIYLRLDVEGLREVGLPLPASIEAVPS